MSPHDMQCALIALAVVMILGTLKEWMGSHVQVDETPIEKRNKQFYLRSW